MNHNLTPVGCAVRFRTEILDRGVIVKSGQFTRNLILDGGLDMLAEYAFSQVFQYLHLGTGTKPTKRDTGTVTIARSGTAVSASGAFFVAEDVGRLIKLDSGPEFYVSDYTSATAVTAATSGSNSAEEATIWYVNESAHEAQFLNCVTYIPGDANNFSAFVSGTWTHSRIFLTDAFSVGKLVSEIGWSPAGGNLYGRALVPGGGDYVAAGQQYRVIVQHLSTWGPTGATTQADIGNNGFSTAGEFALEYVACPNVNQNGDSSQPASYGRMNGLSFVSAYYTLHFGYSAAALTPLAGGWIGRVGAFRDILNGDVAVRLNAGTYTSGTHTRQWIGTVPVGLGNSTGIRSISLAYGGSDEHCARLLLSSPQTKDDLHTLTLGFSFGWGRVLAN